MSSFDRYDREDDEQEARDIRARVGGAVQEALAGLQLPQGSTVVIQNLHISIGSINSARGGGATVTVNMVSVPKADRQEVQQYAEVRPSFLPNFMARLLPAPRS